MDKLQKHIIELDRKVDQLHQIVERLSSQITALTSERQQQSNNGTEPFPTVARMMSYSSPSHRSFNSIMEHKDILLDGNDGESNASQKGEQAISPDIQIRRLTAQLTAAYNRIAALEEQLLACRIHS